MTALLEAELTETDRDLARRIVGVRTPFASATVESLIQAGFRAPAFQTGSVDADTRVMKRLLSSVIRSHGHLGRPAIADAFTAALVAAGCSRAPA